MTVNTSMRMRELIRIAEGHAMPVTFYHATTTEQWLTIRTQGLVPSDASHPGRPAAIYLTDQIGVARNYADMNFGEDDEQATWVILSIAGSALDERFLRPDIGHETQMALKDIMALGYTKEQIHRGDFPWWVSLNETGQAVYEQAIPANAIRLVEQI